MGWRTYVAVFDKGDEAVSSLTDFAATQTSAAPSPAAAVQARSHMQIVELLARPLAAQTAALLLDEAVDGAVGLPQQTLAAMLGVHRQWLNRIQTRGGWGRRLVLRGRAVE